LSGALTHKLGPSEWPPGGTKNIQLVKAAQQQIWRKNMGGKTKELIGLWLQYCQELREQSLLSSCQDNAVKLGIELMEGGTPKPVEVLKRECLHKKRSLKDREASEIENMMDGIKVTDDDTDEDLSNWMTGATTPLPPHPPQEQLVQEQPLAEPTL